MPRSNSRSSGTKPGSRTARRRWRKENQPDQMRRQVPHRGTSPSRLSLGAPGFRRVVFGTVVLRHHHLCRRRRAHLCRRRQAFRKRPRVHQERPAIQNRHRLRRRLISRKVPRPRHRQHLPMEHRSRGCGRIVKYWRLRFTRDGSV